jgi:glucuronoarabinoxylan endo-1,4-beta-xylanase
MKDNNNIVGGRLNTSSYGAYADHLVGYRDFMESNGVSMYAISLQNEPDIDVTYESCYWSPQEMIDWLNGQASKFGDTRLMVAESFNFNRRATDPILNDASAEPLVDIIAGHIYGNGLYDYPLAREKGKEVWMTEHLRDSGRDANEWPLALGVGREIHDCMAANFNAYIWWYIRRSYGLITEDGNVSKRGYLMAQYSKFVRPGYYRVGATNPSASNVRVTAYRGPEGQIAVVAVNESSSSQTITLDVYNGCVDAFAKYTTSASKNVNDDGVVTATNNSASVTLDAQSITTFVSQ